MRSNRRAFLRHVGLAAAFVAAGGCRTTAMEDRRPQFVVFLADDKGGGDLRSSGNTNPSTAHRDSLAKD